MSQHFDLIVIGAGMAGVAAANKGAGQGWQVAIVDALPYGGTCALRGCDPKKILRRGAEIIDSARLMRGKGIDDAGLSIDWPDLMKHKHGFTDPVPQSMEDGLTDNGVTTLHGQARFIGPRQLEIDGASFDADRFLVATGARPRPLDFPGHEHLIDSTDFLDLEELPSRILFVGGGFISFEFAHIAARAGSSPVIVDRGERPLKPPSAGARVLADAGPVEQCLGDGGRTVAEGHQPDPETPECSDAVGHVGMHGKDCESVHDVGDSFRGPTLQGEAVKADPQRLGRNVGERVAGPHSGECEAIAQQPREPGGRQVGWGADVLEPLRHGRHVRERLVDVEDQQAWGSGTVRTGGMVDTGKNVVHVFARHVRHRSLGSTAPGCRRSLRTTPRRASRSFKRSASPTRRR